jgi:hypothetical protein
MGEKQNQPFQLSFNTSLRVDFQGSRVTSDGGLLLARDLDECLGLSALSLLQKRGAKWGDSGRVGAEGRLSGVLR